MRKRKLLHYLTVITGIIFIINSCRHENLAENYATNRKGSLLNAKTISLNQSNHKNKILQSLTKAESILNDEIQKSYNGKVVNFGDSIHIDTDHVIYIENGPNYHTYTFNIQTKNSTINSPVVNLILTPLPDGSYMEFLATYHISHQEKQKLLRGIAFDSKGKVDIIRLQKGTFNNGNILTGRSTQSCRWVEETLWDP